jgi:hypothetical protein
MRILCLFLGAVGLLLPLQARADDAASLLAKHVAYVGWQSGDPAMLAWRLGGTRIEGKNDDRFSEVRRGLLFHDVLRTRDRKISIDEGFTGRLMWKADPNGYVVTLLRGPAKVAFDLDALLDEATATFPDPTIDGSAQVRGVQTTIVSVSPKGLPPIDLYVDPATGAYLRAVIDPKGPHRTDVEILSYMQAAPGKKIAGRYDVGHARYHVARVQVGANVTNAALEPPPARAAWTFSGPQFFPIDTYIQSTASREIRVQASVDGHPGVFLLDTGTPGIIVFDAFARSAGLVPLGESHFSPFAGDPRDRGYVNIASLDVSGNVLHDVLVEDIADSSRHIDGILGYDFFAGMLANVELSKGVMQILDPVTTSPAVSKGAYAFPIDLTHLRPVVSVTIGSGAVAHPRFGTGDNYFMLLSQALRDDGKIQAPNVTQRYSTSITGARSDTVPVLATYSDYAGANGTGNCVVVPKVMIGPYRYENPPLCFIGSGAFGPDGGLVGLDFLRHFNWEIDYPKGTFVLAPNGQ